MRNAEEHTQTSLEDKFPLLEIDPELTKVMPPDEVIELVNACVSLSGYSRNDIRNAFFRALSVPALDVYVDTDQRCKAAIDIVVNELENRFPDKPKLEFEWKGESSNLSELKVIDKYGNGLFTEYWIAEPTELGLNGERAFEEPDAPAIHDTQVLNAPEDVNIPEDVNALEVVDAPLIPYSQEIPDALEVDSYPEYSLASEDVGAVEVAHAPEILSIPEVLDASEVDVATKVNAPTEIPGASAIPELVLSSPSPAKKRARKTSEASNNSMILAEILQELREIKVLLKDKS